MRVRSVACALLLSLAALAAIAEERCGPRELGPADPAYSSAVLLRQDLSNHAFEVQCVLPSKMVGMCGNAQQGNENAAALFRTDRGDFEALFLPEPFTFDDMTVKEEITGNSYHYSFSGHPSCGTMEGTQRLYFIKRGNKMLIVFGDAELASAMSNVPLR
jgi:hypothetical protein